MLNVWSDYDNVIILNVGVLLLFCRWSNLAGRVVFYFLFGGAPLFSSYKKDTA